MPTCGASRPFEIRFQPRWNRMSLRSTNNSKFEPAYRLEFWYPFPLMDAKLETFLDENNAAFIQSGVSICASSCNPDRTSALARAVGCRVSKDRRSVTLLFPKSRAEALLAAIESGGKIAAIFTEPPTHISLQLKGIDATL